VLRDVPEGNVVLPGSIIVTNAPELVAVFGPESLAEFPVPVEDSGQSAAAVEKLFRVVSADSV
jgi:hypothetical protein